MNLKNFILKGVFVLFVLHTYSNLYGQEKLEVSGLIGTNYAILKNDPRIEENRNWYPGIISGANIVYNINSKIAVESGLFYEKIRIGQYVYPYSQSGTGYATGERESINSSFNYINLPLNLSYNLYSNFGFFGGFGYRFATGKKVNSYIDAKDNEPFVNIGLFYKIDQFKFRLGYSNGLKDGAIGEFLGGRNRNLSLTLSYPFLTK